MRFTKITRSLTVGALGLGLVLAAGAGCSDSHAKYVDPNGPNTVVTLDQIDIQDFNKAATDMVQSLLNSGVLDQAQRRPAEMWISRITNTTTQRVDTDLLIKNIRVALNQSGKVRTSTANGLGGRAEDPLARDSQRAQEFYNGTNRQPPNLPDYTLSGKIIETTARAGDTRQITYTFQLSLSDRSGTAAWEDQRQITKQGKRNAVGW
jgi:penicillin-binding protein activator